MPTGYTADVKDGISFRTFAMNCARAFGACVTLRDEDGGGQHIPEKFEPSDYHEKELVKLRATLSELRLMTPERQCSRAEAAYREAEDSRLKRLAENQIQIQSYRDMLEQVKLWTPPTDDHAELKKFMEEQLTSSIKFDDMQDYYSKPTEPLTGEKWLEEQLASTIKSIRYHEEEHQKEVDRANERTAWVQALRGALPPQ